MELHLKLKAKHFEGSEALSVHNCAVSKALREYYPEVDPNRISFNGITATVGSVFFGRKRKVDTVWKDDPYSVTDYKRHETAAKNRMSEDVICELIFPFAPSK